MVIIPIKGIHADTPYDIIEGDSISFPLVTYTIWDVVGVKLVIEPKVPTNSFNLVSLNNIALGETEEIVLTHSDGITLDNVSKTIQINPIIAPTFKVPQKACLKLQIQKGLDVIEKTIFEYSINIVKC
jgi:hypothetical protein